MSTLDQEAGRKILAEWGFGLEPDTASLEMLVVKQLCNVTSGE